MIRESHIEKVWIGAQTTKTATFAHLGDLIIVCSVHKQLLEGFGTARDICTEAHAYFTVNECTFRANRSTITRQCWSKGQSFNVCSIFKPTFICSEDTSSYRSLQFVQFFSAFHWSPSIG